MWPLCAAAAPWVPVVGRAMGCRSTHRQTSHRMSTSPFPEVLQPDLRVKSPLQLICFWASSQDCCVQRPKQPGCSA